MRKELGLLGAGEGQAMQGPEQHWFIVYTAPGPIFPGADPWVKSVR